MSSAKFEKLLEPIDLGGMRLKNRMVMPAMSIGMATDDGYVTERLLDYFEERARGGVGLIIVGYAVVEFPRGLTGPKRIAVDDDKFLPGLTSLAQRIKQNGAHVALQLNHAGGFAISSFAGSMPVAPSAVICRVGGEIPRAMTVDDIQAMKLRFVEGAQRAQKAGFEAVEIHSATGYLLNQFLSPAKNKRTDVYGGDLPNRARFLLEIIAAIREKVGASYPLWVRLNGKEFGVRGGITLEDTSELSRILEKAGCCAINLTHYGTGYPFHQLVEPAGSFVYLAEAVKKAVRIPVMAGGRITPEVAERALQKGDADLVTMGRQLLADPELPNKVASGRLDEVAPCITCLSCRGRSGDARCTVNPALGMEKKFRPAPARKVKNVLVIGGGAAGMEAAVVAARRGHRVTLFEKGNRLGGRMRMATRMPHKARIADLNDYLSRLVSRLGVKVELGKTVTPELVKRMKPDAVIIAAGGRIPALKWIAGTLSGLLLYGDYSRVEEVGRAVTDGAGRRQTFGPHSMLTAVTKADQRLVKEVQAIVSEVYIAGDCMDPYGMMEAVASGARAGLEV
ncbi:MAG: NADH:flavin oxidoreductase/NADH oxidase [Dehalococcoidia bacterium]|nr:NADH:flavin oxidoreductase/NADH oxidase [Dehalococcoidia bacterium]